MNNEAVLRLLTNAVNCAAKADPEKVRAAWLKYSQPETPSMAIPVPSPAPSVQRAATTRA